MLSTIQGNRVPQRGSSLVSRNDKTLGFSQLLNKVQPSTIINALNNTASLLLETTNNQVSQCDHTADTTLTNARSSEKTTQSRVAFPPASAPLCFHEAWAQATHGLSPMDVMSLEMTMHFATNNMPLEQQDKTLASAQTDEQQSQALLDCCWADLEEKAKHEGWNAHNMMLKDFYQHLDNSLKRETTSRVSSGYAPSSSTSSQDVSEAAQQAKRILGLIVDARLGIARQKLDEIDEKIKQVENDESLAPEQKQQMLEDLKQKKERLLEESQQRLVEEEKRKARQLAISGIN